MRCSGTRFASRFLDGSSLLLRFRLVVRRRRQQRQLNRIRDVIREQFVADRTRFVFQHLIRTRTTGVPGLPASRFIPQGS